MSATLNSVADVRAALKACRKRLANGYRFDEYGWPLDEVIAVCEAWLRLHPDGPLSEDEDV